MSKYLVLYLNSYAALLYFASANYVNILLVITENFINLLNVPLSAKLQQ